MIKRKYIRHPASIPLEYKILGKFEKNKDYIKDISVGGLCFKSHSCVEDNVTLSIQIQATHPAFNIVGKVVWCSKHQDYVEIGVEFFKPGDAFKARMIEQICQIKQYQKEVTEKEGRELSDEKAAFEWIEKFAGKFPD